MNNHKNLFNIKKEQLTLGEIITEIHRGHGVNREQLGTGNQPCVYYSDLHTIYDIWFDKCLSTIDPQLVKNEKYCEYGDLIITSIGEEENFVAKTCAYLGQEKAVVGFGLFIVKHNQNPKYLSYALTSNVVFRQKARYPRIRGHINLSSNEIKKLSIFLPSLEDQESIAEFLDEMRILTREYIDLLKLELDLNRKRYYWCINKLIGAHTDKLTSMGEIMTDIHGGTDLSSRDIWKGDCPCVMSDCISNAYYFWFKRCNFTVDSSLLKNPKYFEHGDLLMVSVTHSMRFVGYCCAYLGDKKAIAGPNIFIIKHNQNPKYLAYALSTYESIWQKNRLSLLGSTSMHLNISDVKKMQIPLPGTDIQQQIVDFLDKLLQLWRDLEERLTKELDLVEERYWYYKRLLIEEV